jgi:diguanylate cyclase (GGDEF)-like protein
MPVNRPTSLRGTLAFVRNGLRALVERCGGCRRRMTSMWQWLGERFDTGSNSLANRVLLLQLAWAAVAYLLVVMAMWFAGSLVIEKSLRDQGESWVAKLDELGTPLYASDEPALRGEIIAELQKYPDIAAVEYLGADGREAIARYSREGAPVAPFPPLGEAELQRLSATDSGTRPLFYDAGEGKRVSISAPIWVKSIPADGLLDFSLNGEGREQTRVIGYLSVVLDYSRYYQALHRTLGNASLAIALLMLLTALVGRLLVRWALAPLARLEVPLTRLANGETDVTVESSGDREIASIGKALNTTINAIRERDETLLRMANHDALTGLANRSFFTAQLEREVERIAAEGGSSALLFIDLDRFKFINDSYGHAAGDRLLTQVAQLLMQRMREGDLVARFGGDEFTALVPKVNIRGAREVAASLIELMRGFEFHEGGAAQRIHFSIGVTLIDDGALSADDYLLQADAAVHEAKAAGRNGFHVFDATTRVNREDLGGGWFERLSGALESRTLTLFYQRVFPLGEDGETVYEVLLRLPDTQKGMIAPGAFFPAAERFGLMAAIDRQVIGQAVELLQQPSLQGSVLSVNLSSQVCLEGDLVAFLEGLFGDSGLEPHRLIFEIPEQQLMRQLDRFKPLLQQLNGLGCRLAIDDFGTGCAAFNFLKHIPFQWIKIDGTLIERMRDDRLDRITVRAIAESAAELGVETVAKCVPDRAMLGILRQMGIGYAQGDCLGSAGPEPR